MFAQEVSGTSAGLQPEKGFWPSLGLHPADRCAAAPRSENRFAAPPPPPNPASALLGNWGRRAFRRSRGWLQLSWRRPSGTLTRGKLCIAPGTPCATCASGSRLASEPRGFMLSDNSSLNVTAQCSAAPTSAYNPAHCLRGLPASPLTTRNPLHSHLPDLPKLFQVPAPPEFLGALCPQHTLSSLVFPLEPRAPLTFPQLPAPRTLW